MSKKISEWLEELPEPARSQAIHNFGDDDDEVVDSLENAIYEAFYWNETPEGLEYWVNIKNQNIE